VRLSITAAACAVLAFAALRRCDRARSGEPASPLRLATLNIEDFPRDDESAGATTASSTTRARSRCPAYRDAVSDHCPVSRTLP
jgi:hypothetical protein